MSDYETVDSSGAVVVLNGDRPTAPRRLPVRHKMVYLTGEYVGWTAMIRTNAPVSLFLKLAQMGQQEDGTATLQALAELINVLPSLVIDWNFVDELGEALPCNRAGMERLPTDLLMELVGALGNATGSEGVVPKS